MLRDILRGEIGLDPILAAAPDILLLTDFDYDAGHVTLDALRATLAEAGLDYSHRFAARPNTGWQTGLDLDGDGRIGGPRDAQGYGWFSGQGGQALLSRWPLTLLQDRSAVLWGAVPGTAMAADDPGAALQRLATTAFWAVRVERPAAPFTLLTVAATPPVFDGPEDRNGRRNRDEVLFWTHVLDGRLGDGVPGPVVLLGNLNLDPDRGDGLRDAAARLLAQDRLQDPLPGVPTVAWDSTGPMRVSYVLPDAALRVLGAGVTPPDAAEASGPHGLVWADISPAAAPDDAPGRAPTAALAAR